MEISNSKQFHLLTNSKSLFDIISEGSRANKKGLILNAYAASHGYKEKQIGIIDFVTSDHSITDGHTKTMI